MDDYQSKKDEENIKYPFENLTKMHVLQESKIFSETKPKIKNCILLITKILYVLGQGVKLKTDEYTSLFLQCTILFGVKNKKLRRMLYLILKDLSKGAEQTYIACSSLSKDMNTSDEKKFPFKANAVRTLRAISDIQTIETMERHFVEALVDQNPSVSSSAVISGLFIALENLEIVKRWTKQIVSSMKSRFYMPQYHSLALMYKLQSRDRLSVSKLVSSSSFGSPLAQCLLIRYACKVLRKEKADSKIAEALTSFLTKNLASTNEMIVLEAVKAITSVPFMDDSKIKLTISAIQSSLLSTSYDFKGKSVAKYAGLKILYKLAGKYPTLVSSVSTDLEELIQDSNKNISTLSITTLLKCSSNDSNIENLTNQISAFMGEISDEFKTSVINSMKNLIPRCPKHHRAMLKFLNTVFTKFEGGYEVKHSIVQAIIAMIESNEKIYPYGITVLCELIEDCEFDNLLKEIIHYIGKFGPKTKKPGVCIRYLYNRLFLESPSVRAAAVDALGKFCEIQHLQKSIIVMMKRIVNDENDEVRDRVLYSIDLIEGKIKEQVKIEVDYEALERNLCLYVNDEELHVESFDINKMKEKEKEKEEVKREQEKKVVEEIVDVDSKSIYYELVEKIPQLGKLGKPFKTCAPILLTEKEGDYIVKCTKHVYKKNIVFQFDCTNNVRTQKLTNVGIEVNFDEVEGLDTSFSSSAKAIEFGATKPILLCTEYEEGQFPVGNFSSNLTFKIVEDEEEYDDEEDLESSDYELEDCIVRISDYVINMNLEEFKKTWEELGNDNEKIRKFDFTKRNIVEMSQSLVDVLSLVPLNKLPTDESKDKQSLYFCGKNTKGIVILIATHIVVSKKKTRVVLYCRTSKESKEFREIFVNKFSI